MANAGDEAWEDSDNAWERGDIFICGSYLVPHFDNHLAKRGFKRNIYKKRSQRHFQRYIKDLDARGESDHADIHDPKRLSQSWSDRNEVTDTGDPDIEIDIVPVDKEEAQWMISHGECYPFKSECRGRAIIVNMQKFDPKSRLSDRPASDVDARNLEKLYTRLGFTTVIWDNLTKDELLRNVKEERTLSDHQNSDAFMITVLSHGDKSFVYCSDGKELELELLYELFDDKECPALIGKPKIFIIQACQENETTRVVRSDDDEVKEETDKPNDEKSTDSADAIGNSTSVQSRADFVVACCVVPVHKSYRNTENGTLFIRALIYSFMEFCHIDYFQDIILEVNNKLTKENIVVEVSGKEERSMGRPETKKVYFLPEYHE